MVRNKIFEWIGFVIVLISVAVNGTLRAKGITTGTEINLTIIGIIVGLVLAFTFFFIRKFRTKETLRNS